MVGICWGDINCCLGRLDSNRLVYTSPLKDLIIYMVGNWNTHITGGVALTAFSVVYRVMYSLRRSSTLLG